MTSGRAELFVCLFVKALAHRHLLMQRAHITDDLELMVLPGGKKGMGDRGSLWHKHVREPRVYPSDPPQK